MRKPVIAGNWKLFKTSPEAVELVKDLSPLVKDNNSVEVIVAPVFTVLANVATALSGTGIHLAGQNCFWEQEGAFTGEISPKMLRDAGCSHVIIGHSERRQYFAESDETINRKVRAAVASDLKVLFCIGETLEERESDKTFVVLKRQLIAGLAGITNEEISHVIVAYEPVWAIGTGRTASDLQAQEAHSFIRNCITKMFDKKGSEELRILYGGSVKPENIRSLMDQPDIDGALVGGASLKAESFAAIVNYAV